MLTSNNAFEDAFNAGAAPPRPAAPTTQPPQAAPATYTPPAVTAPAPQSQSGAGGAAVTPSNPNATVNAPAPASADPFAAPANATAHPSTLSSHASNSQATEGPRLLVQFTQNEPCKGKEWRAKTYFVINSRVLMASSQFNAPVVLDAPHLQGLDTGVRRNDWDRGSQATVERRYSELHELREVLTFQFPGLILPPLPAKKISQNVETTFNAVDATKLQQTSIETFLTELARLPDVIFFSFFVSGFFMNARQTFLDVTLPAMQQFLSQYRERTKPMHQCSTRQRTLADSALGAVTSTTSWFRGVASLVTGGNQESAKPNGNGRTDDAGVPVVEDDEYHLSALNAVQRADGERWLHVMATLRRRQKVLQKSAELYEKWLVALNGTTLQDQQLAETMETVKNATSAAKETSTAAQASATVLFFDDVSVQDKAFLTGLYSNVRRRLAFERNGMDAALDAIDRVLCIYAYAVSPGSQESMGRKAALTEYAQKLSADLWSDYNTRWQPCYRVRMQNLCTKHILTPRMNNVEAVRKLADQSRLGALIRSNAGASV